MALTPQRTVAATAEVNRDRLGTALELARGLDQLHSLSVSVLGSTIVAEAFRGPSLDVPVNVKSVSKTLLATLVLIALDKGVFSGTDQPVLPLIRDLAPRKIAPGVADVTLDHLLTMRSGLIRTSGANYGAWVNSPNWVGYILGAPPEASPGARMSYSTGDFHILSAALTRATGRSVHALATEWLAEPLGIALPAWNRDPQGIYMGGNNMAISPEAMVRFGRMALAGGTFEGRRIVSEAWMRQAWTARTRSPYSGHEYGYGWFTALLGGERVYYARGYGGQMIYVAPALDAVVAITSDPNRPARSQGFGGELNRLAGQHILPALRA